MAHQAIGLIETRGLVALVEGTDAMLKAANVELAGPMTQVGNALVTAVVVGRTLFGYRLRLTGDAPRAARFAGFSSKKTTLAVFAISGGLAGLAGISEVAGQIGQLQATAATGFELKVIAAVVLGGTSIKGGYGSNAAPVIGAVLVGMILNALTLNRVPGTFELLVLGALILAAVSFDGVKRLIAGERGPA